MTVADRLAATAERLIGKLGADCVVTVETGGTLNVTTEAFTGATTTTPTVRIVPPSAVKELAEGGIRRTGELVTWAAANPLTFTPKAGLELTFDGETFRIVSVVKIISGGGATPKRALWELTLAGGGA